MPIHEQEEHRRFHAEPPYMGQKIRIENGQPIIIDRKERASLTPIGMYLLLKSREMTECKTGLCNLTEKKIARRSTSVAVN